MKFPRPLPLASLLLTGILLLSPADLAAEDWPQFRHDSARTGSTAEQLPEKLHLQWSRDFPAPRPAFPTEIRLRFDTTYEPVVSGDSVFVPSMVTDSVAAFDVENGGEKWRFFTGGPVRFAPCVSGDGEKLYVTSDDGFLYCLDAGDGSLWWKFRGLPADRKDRKLLGNQRLISLWPGRGGPVVHGGAVFFAAGLWPGDGIFVHSLDADTGEVRWSNTDSHFLERVNVDHGVFSDAGVTPQGYLAILGGKLVVACGAQLPAMFTSDNGCEFHGYRELEDSCEVTFYFAHPYHSWERGTNENTNGLIRQYLPKGCCMNDLTQARCNAIARKLNQRPRKRHGFRTPAELFENPIDVALHS